MPNQTIQEHIATIEALWPGAIEAMANTEYEGEEGKSLGSKPKRTSRGKNRS